MLRIMEWLAANHESLVTDLRDLVAIQGVSTDGMHGQELVRTATLTRDLMLKAGLQKASLLTCDDSPPYVYGEWLGAPGQPTLFMYSHYDVQPVHQQDIDQHKWQTPPWTLTRKGDRLYARGSSDDKGGVIAQLGAIAATLHATGRLPVNIKMLVEGEEEIGSPNLFTFFDRHQSMLQADAIVVTDTDNFDVGFPSLTNSLRGNVVLLVEVESADAPVHSGMAGGALADAAIALAEILSRLYTKGAALPIPGFYDRVRPLTDHEQHSINSLSTTAEAWHRDQHPLPGVTRATETGVHPFEQTWRRPGVTITALEASSIRGASNQVLPRAAAMISCRIVPDQDPEEVVAQLTAFLTKDPPWNVRVKVTPQGNAVKWWITDPKGPAFEAALAALESGFGRTATAIGAGGTIGFVGPLSKMLGDAPALLFGIGDPHSSPHAPNENLHEGNWSKLIASLVHFFANMGELRQPRH
jgi:acetylornithine deacetylase/succinyl-diaminopimelate desuccinylase-like protein